MSQRIDRTRGKRARGCRAAAVRLALLGTVSAVSLACGERQSNSIQTRLGESVFEGSIPVDILKLKAQDFAETFDVPGHIEAEEEVTISSEVAARVVAIGPDIGDEPGAGDLLVGLDDARVLAEIRKINAQLARTNTLLKTARKNLGREAELFATSAASERTLDDARTLVETYENEAAAIEADLEIAGVELAKHRIESPIHGMVAKRHVAVGEYVNPGVELYDIVMTDVVEFVFSLSESDVTKIQPGEELVARIDAHGGKRFSGRVKSVAPAGDRQTRTFGVELSIENPPPHLLRPGMSGRVEVTRARYNNVYLIPEDSIMRQGDREFVYLAASGGGGAGEGEIDMEFAVDKDVDILASVGSSAVIAADLGSNPRLIILGQYALEPGSNLRVRREHDEIPKLVFD